MYGPALVPMKAREIHAVSKAKWKKFTRRDIAILFVEFHKQYGHWPNSVQVNKLSRSSRENWPPMERISERGGLAHITKIAEEILATGKSEILGD
jgi:hypothetical protein